MWPRLFFEPTLGGKEHRADIVLQFSSHENVRLTGLGILRGLAEYGLRNASELAADRLDARSGYGTPPAQGTPTLRVVEQARGQPSYVPNPPLNPKKASPAQVHVIDEIVIVVQAGESMTRHDEG